MARTRKINIIVDVLDNSTKGVNAISGSLSRLARNWFLVYTALNIGFRAISAGWRELINTISAGADLKEQINFFAVTFQNSAIEMYKRFDKLSEVTRRNRFDVLEWGATLTSTVMPMVQNRDIAKEWGYELTKLAIDFASLRNVEPAEMVEDIGSAVVGNVEAMRRWGITLTVSMIETEALRMAQEGLIDATKTSYMEMDEATRASVRYSLIQRSLQDSMNDAENTAYELQNAWRGLTGELREIRSEVGFQLVPTMAELVNGLYDYLPVLRNLGMGWAGTFAGMVKATKAGVKAILKLFGVNISTLPADMEKWGAETVVAYARGMAQGMVAIIQVINQISKILINWFQPHSPPKIAPDIDKWGRDTIQAWVDGFQLADFSSIGSLAGMVQEELSEAFKDNMGKGKEIFVTLKENIINAFSAIRNGSDSISVFNSLGKSVEHLSSNMKDYIMSLFDYEAQQTRVINAQETINKLNAKWSNILDPLYEKLNKIKNAQQDQTDGSRIEELQKKLANSTLLARKREQYQLELQALMLEKEVREKETLRDKELAGAEKVLSEEEKKLALLEKMKAYRELMLDLAKEEAGFTEKISSGAESMASALAGATGSLGQMLEEWEGSVPSITASMTKGLEGLFESDLFGEVLAQFAPVEEALGQLGGTWGELGKQVRLALKRVRIEVKRFRLEAKKYLWNVAEELGITGDTWEEKLRYMKVNLKVLGLQIKNFVSDSIGSFFTFNEEVSNEFGINIPAQVALTSLAFEMLAKTILDKLGGNSEVSKALDEIAVQWDRINEETGGSVDRLNVRIRKALYAMLGFMIGYFLNGLLELALGLTTFIETTDKAIANVMKNISLLSGEALKNYQKLNNWLIEQPFVKLFIKNLVGTFSVFFNYYNMVYDLITGKKSLSDAFQELKDMFSFDSWKSNMDGAIENIENWFFTPLQKKVDEASIGFVGGQQTITTGFVAWLGEQVFEQLNWLEQFDTSVSTTLEEVKTRFSIWSLATKLTMQAWIYDIIVKFTNWKTDMLAKVDEMKIGFLETLGLWRDDSNVVVDEVNTKFSDFATYLQEEFYTLISGALDSVATKYDGWKNSIIGHIQGILDKINELISAWNSLSGMNVPSVPSVSSPTSPSRPSNGLGGVASGLSNSASSATGANQGARRADVSIVYNINTSGNNVNWKNDVDLANAFNPKI